MYTGALDSETLEHARISGSERCDGPRDGLKQKALQIIEFAGLF
jgi:hypothetical protein